MTREECKARGAKAYRDGVRWVAACPYQDGTWQASAWKDGWWDERELAEAQVPFGTGSDNPASSI